MHSAAEGHTPPFLHGRVFQEVTMHGQHHGVDGLHAAHYAQRRSELPIGRRLLSFTIIAAMTMSLGK